jgi:hypothetical protein
MISHKYPSRIVRITSQCTAVAFAVAVIPLGCEAQQGPCSAAAAQITITPGFFTGDELSLLTDDQLGMYAGGYIDALQAATIIGVTDQCRRALQACVIGQSRGELAAAIRKYLREHPNWWYERSNGILYNALFSQCLHHPR